jgi:thioredoxin-dependent peroxiredoxin
VCPAHKARYSFQVCEGLDFKNNFAHFSACDAVIFGISRDSLKSHENFKCKQEFPFELISDADESLCQLFDVIRQKKMYGKDVRGIERSTFVLDGEGVLRHEWRGVKVDGHVDAVLDAVRQLSV